MHARSIQRPARVLALATLGLAAGCAGLAFGPPALEPGTTLDQAIAKLGPPTGRHRIADGATRLEYWGGNYAKATWMIDFDAAGRLVAANQVLTEANFYALPAGITREELRVRMGPPMSTFAIPRQHIQVWNYRYQTNDCLWFQVSIRDADGRVGETTRGIDPSCDAPNDARS